MRAMSNHRAHLLVLPILAAHLAVAAVAVAGPLSPKEAAAEHVARAAPLVGEHKWAAARVEYEAAMALDPQAVTMSSIAYCLQQEGDPAAAAERYRTALETNRAQTVPDAQLEKDINEQLLKIAAVATPPAPAPAPPPVVAPPAVAPGPRAPEVSASGCPRDHGCEPVPGKVSRVKSTVAFASAGALGIAGGVARGEHVREDEQPDRRLQSDALDSCSVLEQRAWSDPG
jgi:hypothetical protein